MEKRNKNIFVVVRNDDICALSNVVKERRFFKIFEKYNIPQIISVIPNVADDIHNAFLYRYHKLEGNQEIVLLLKEYCQKGLIEISQHGCTHQTNLHHPCKANSAADGNLYYTYMGRRILPYMPQKPDGFSEFNRLPYKTAREKIIWGKHYLENVFDAKVEMFTPPWNSFDWAVLKALKDIKFKYVLSGANMWVMQGMNIVNCFCEDIFELPQLIKGVTHFDLPALVQILYHSEALKMDEISKLDAMLKDLNERNEVHFVTLGQIKKLYASLDSVLYLNASTATLSKNKDIFKQGTSQVSYYILNLNYYRTMLFALYVKIVFKCLKKALSFGKKYADYIRRKIFETQSQKRAA